MRALALLRATGLLIAGSASGDTLAGNEAAAQRDAQVLLGRIQLPADAVTSATNPAGGSALGGPGLYSLTPAQVDLHAWWRGPESWDRHRDAGTTGKT